jgi:hypothetical protein
VPTDQSSHYAFPEKPIKFEVIMTQKYLDGIAIVEGEKSTLPTLTKADRVVTVGGTDRFLIQVKRGRFVETVDLLCIASGFAELRAIVKRLKLGAIVNWEPQVATF